MSKPKEETISVNPRALAERAIDAAARLDKKAFHDAYAVASTENKRALLVDWLPTVPALVARGENVCRDAIWHLQFDMSQLDD